MRRFLILAHRVPTDGEFTLNDLAGGAGRLDEVARAVSTAFTLSNDLRRDTEVSILFVASPPPKARRIDLFGAGLRFLNPDERSTAALLKNALVRSRDFPHPFESSPGLVVAAVEPMPSLRTFLEQPNAVLAVRGRASHRAVAVQRGAGRGGRLGPVRPHSRGARAPHRERCPARLRRPALVADEPGHRPRPPRARPPRGRSHGRRTCRPVISGRRSAG